MKPTGHIHSARLSSSVRLTRVANLMGDGRPRTTLEIIQGAQVCAVNSCISELRRNGWQIDCTRKGDTWTYRVTGVVFGAAS